LLYNAEEKAFYSYRTINWTEKGGKFIRNDLSFEIEVGKLFLKVEKYFSRKYKFYI
jgi:hypothetical protein